MWLYTCTSSCTCALCITWWWNLAIYICVCVHACMCVCACVYVCVYTSTVNALTEFATRNSIRSGYKYLLYGTIYSVVQCTHIHTQYMYITWTAHDTNCGLHQRAKEFDCGVCLIPTSSSSYVCACVSPALQEARKCDQIEDARGKPTTHFECE